MESKSADRNIPKNKLNIVVPGNVKRMCMLVEVAIWLDRNVIKEETEKILIKKTFRVDIQRMWLIKTNVTSNNIGNWNHLKII
jgi:hypothetical protein